MITIRFLTSVADDRSPGFVQGQVVRYHEFPLGWEKWLDAGIIEVVAQDVERAVAPIQQAHAPIETAVAAPMRRRRRRGADAA